MAWPCAPSRAACCRPTAGRMRRRSPSRSGAARLPNPIGLAAGFDKNAEVPDALLGIGFGLVEIGSVTPRPQEGNPRPRLFRLPEDRGVINRMGFPGQGLERCARGSPCGRGAASSASMSAPTRTAPTAPPTTSPAAWRWRPTPTTSSCNVSSPNTPGLRNLQGRDAARRPLKRVQDAIAAKPVPLLVKIAPDATDDDLDDIVAVCRDLRMDGIIVGNTTLSRPPTLRSARRGETGGLVRRAAARPCRPRCCAARRNASSASSR